MKKYKKLIIIVLVLFISIGFAYLSTNLGINTTLNFKENTWDIHFDNVEVYESSSSNPTISLNDDNNSITFSNIFDIPTDYIDIAFNVVNSGTVPASLNSITTSITTEQKKYLSYNFHYYFDDSEVKNNDVVYAGQSRRIKAHFEYRSDIDNFIDTSNMSITLSLKYDLVKNDSTVNVWNYAYSGTEQYFYVPKSGTYKLEVWGAQGSNEYATGGYGGYSVGEIILNKNSSIYINVGGHSLYSAGYNGGGISKQSPLHEVYQAFGGGATHIAAVPGLLSSLSDNISDIYIVAGGGGGSMKYSASCAGGSAGGYIAGHMYFVTYPSKTCVLSQNYGASQSNSGSENIDTYGKTIALLPGSIGLGNLGGGGGFYGGGSYRTDSRLYSGSGGSGYIGNTNLKNKIMYCYNCPSSENEEDETNIKTRSTTNASETPTSNYAKIGDGHVRITYIG